MNFNNSDSFNDVSAKADGTNDNLAIQNNNSYEFSEVNSGENSQQVSINNINESTSTSNNNISILGYFFF